MRLLDWLIFWLLAHRERLLRRGWGGPGRRCEACGCTEAHGCIRIEICGWPEPSFLLDELPGSGRVQLAREAGAVCSACAGKLG